MRVAASALLLLAVSSCRGQDDLAQCHQDGDCATGSACLTDLCVARVGSEPEVWSVEVTPGAQPRYALREFPDFAFTAMRPDLTLDRKISMATALSPKNPNPAIDFSTSVHVVVSVASAIAERGDLQFEADGSNGTATLPYVISVPLPARFLGADARMTVIPVMPLDQYMPPWVLPVKLADSLPLVLPGPADTVTLDGKLESADPRSGLEVTYQARARIGDRLVSNVAVTDEAGRFVVRMQRSALPPDGAGLLVELSPADDTVALPSLVVTPVEIDKPTFDSLRMPAFQKPEPYLVPVIGRAQQAPVVGATVRFKAVVPGASGGRAIYERAAQTGTAGLAMVPLIPGAGQNTRDYSVTITPPSNSGYSARCVAAYAIGPATAPGQRVGATIELDSKVLLDGRVLRADGMPARAVRVRPTRIGDIYSADCGGDLGSPASEQTTGPDGRYSLQLDPGQYRLDCEPPEGTPLPATSVLVTVPETRTMDVVLPSPVLIEGRVLSPNNIPVADAEVRAFGPAPGGGVQRRAVGLTDTAGKFRLILPRHP
jgi:hypothetical protein